MEEERKRREGSAYNRPPVLSEGLRILKLAESLKLSAETLDKIRSKLFGDSGASVSQVEAKHGEIPSPNPARYPQIETIDDAEIDRLMLKAARAEPEALAPDTLFVKPSPAAPARTLDTKSESPHPLQGAIPAPAPRPQSIAMNPVPAPPSEDSRARDEADLAKAGIGLNSGRKTTTEPARAAPANAANSATRAEAERTLLNPIDELLKAELLLRSKVEASQNWSGFKAEAWNLYEKFPRPDTGARLVELALMYGNVIELEEVLASLNRHSVSFLPMMDTPIRTHTLVKLWQGRRFDFLDQFLFRKELMLKLLPIERWYCCWSMIDRGQGDKAYRWFKRYDSEIWNAQKQFGSTLQKSETDLAFVLGHNALLAEDETRGLKLLESIPPNAAEFARAFDLLLDLKIDRDEKGFCAYGQKLNRELDWKARLGLFDSFLIRMQRLEHIVPKDRAALNALLVDPLRWFPESPEAWQLVSEMLLQFAGLERILPNLMKTFSDRATHFFKPPFEHALWSAVLDHDFRNPIKTWYWRSIALLHEFAWGVGQDETKLWESRRLYHEALQHEGKPLPYSWQQLHRGLSQWISKSERLDEAARVRLLLMAKLCGETREVSEEDVTTYLTHVQQPSAEVLDTLENLARERHQWGLELFIQGRKAGMLHHTNQGLNRVWELGIALKRHDLCWRTATVLKSRQVLSPLIERYWATSGEKKREFPIMNLSESNLKRVFQSFEGYERRLVESLVCIGPLVPELLASVHQHLVPLKKTKAPTDLETEVAEALDKMTWLISGRKQFSANPNGLWQPKPAFFSNLIHSRWSLLFVNLAQRLGITTWDWQLSLLNQHIENVVPRLTRASEPLATGKVGRWLRALNPQQRKAWYELAQMAKRFDDAKAQEILGRFLAILTTSIHQDHLGALQNLERMRAPLRLRWDLENWMVSEAYGEIRKALGSQAIAKFPEEVYGIAPLDHDQGKNKLKAPDT